MNTTREFSLRRFWAMVVKEFIQMRRDPLTVGTMIAIPLIQLLLFGYAINSDPKHLATAVLMADNGPQSRTLLYALRNSDYFDFTRQVKTESEGHDALARGQVQFVVNIPEDFTRSLIRGERPSVLIEADATDPASTGYALGALRPLLDSALQNDFKGTLTYLNGTDGPVDLRVHALYNPEVETQFNIVPGLLCVVLSMTMSFITTLAITRERERGTMENLLSMPTHPLEVLLGKIIPYIFVGYVQVGLILSLARFMFHVPMVGSLTLLFAVSFVFIVATLAVGVTFSTVAENQIQAIQMAQFYFLPSLMLSGFMFPFRGMPGWAQAIGEIFPITHFLRIVRGILLKGNGMADVVPQLWQIALFAVIALVIGVKRYRRTLD
jgi:ABC-2 type transport system permease protein